MRSTRRIWSSIYPLLARATAIHILLAHSHGIVITEVEHMSIRDLGKKIGIWASLATIIAACVAVIALIPEFGQWLFPRESPPNSTSVTPVIQPTDAPPLAPVATNTPSVPTPPTVTRVPPTAVPSSTSPPPSLCPDYVPRSTVQEWNIGATDVQTVDEKAEEFHTYRKWQIPPYGNFKKGDLVPAGVVVATAFDGAGRKWSEFPVKPLVHHGDYGLFETLGEYIAPYEGACISIVP